MDTYIPRRRWRAEGEPGSGLEAKKGRATGRKGGFGMAHQEGQCAFAMAREMVLDLIIPHRRKLYGLISPRYLFGHYFMNPLFLLLFFPLRDELTEAGGLGMEAASVAQAACLVFRCLKISRC